MQSLRVHKIVEYIKQREEFPFDGDDVLEELDKVLCFFNILDQLSQEEENLLRDDLFKLAVEEEVREVGYLAGQREADSGLGRQKQSKLLRYVRGD